MKHGEFSTDKTLTQVATANFVLAGPTSGSPAASVFRALVAADIPSLSISSITGTMAQFDTAVSDGNIVYQSQALGTPASGTLTSCTGLPVASGISGLGTGVATALAVNVGSAGAPVLFNGALGTPSSGTLTNCTFPTLNQNTTGSAAKWTTARNLAGNSVDGSANVAFANKFIVQGTADTGLSAAQFLGALGTGIVKNTTTTGVLSIAVAADFPTLNQNTSGSAATLTTTRTIWGQNFNGSANVSGTLALGASDLTLTGSIGATGARATKVWTAALESTAMPTVSGTSLSSTFSAIAGSASIVTVGTITSGTWNATDIAVADGGTGRSTSTTAYGLIAAGTTATGAHQTLAAGATTEILVGGGASALPVWTTATGSGSPVRATSPTVASPTFSGTTTISNANGAGHEGTIAGSTSSPYDIVTITSKGGTGGWQGAINFDTSYNAGATGTVFSIKNQGTTGVANFYFGGSANRATTSGQNIINLFDTPSAPAGTLTNGITLYSSSGEFRVMDAAGNSTLLSPHDTDTNDHIYFSKNTKTGKVLVVETERMWRALDAMLGGGYIHEFDEEPGTQHQPRKDYDENWKKKIKEKI